MGVRKKSKFNLEITFGIDENNEAEVPTLLRSKCSENQNQILNEEISFPEKGDFAYISHPPMGQYEHSDIESMCSTIEDYIYYIKTKNKDYPKISFLIIPIENL